MIVNSIAVAVLITYFSIENWYFLEHLTLADPTFIVPQPVDLLLGAEYSGKF